jgi:uncharacterized protein YndB with AHSA1/START domain
MGTSKITAEPGSLQIIVEREFDAPAEVLLRAHIDPDLLKQWMGPDGLSMEIPTFEPRDGGRWDWVFTGPDGDVQRFHGVTHGTPSVENGMMGTFEWLGLPGHVSFQTMTFEEHDGRTTLRSNSVFQTIEDRDGMIEAGMEHGMNEGYAKLDKLLTTLTPTER